MRTRRSDAAPPASNRDGGFTLVEVLVVLIVIGILAALTIPVFLAQREKAVRASLISDMKQARRLMQTYQLENSGSLGTSCYTSTSCHWPGGPGNVLNNTLGMKFTSGNRVGDFWGGGGGGAANTFHVCIESTDSNGTPTQWHALDTFNGGYEWFGKGGCPWTAVNVTEPQPAP
jgi:type IV pilus assembly protein PilA